MNWFFNMVDTHNKNMRLRRWNNQRNSRLFCGYPYHPSELLSYMGAVSVPPAVGVLAAKGNVCENLNC